MLGAEPECGLENGVDTGQNVLELVIYAAQEGLRVAANAKPKLKLSSSKHRVAGLLQTLGNVRGETNDKTNGIGWQLTHCRARRLTVKRMGYGAMQLAGPRIVGTTARSRGGG